ncbi:MAG: alpha-1,2-fucosyltransferase [Minisyncoccota bacterium]
MIITRLSGGIGNQLFQYAFGRSLSLETTTNLKLDLSSFGEQKNSRAYKLNAFNIRAEVATHDNFKSIGVLDPARRDMLHRTMRWIHRAMEYFVPLSKKKFIIEPSFRFQPELLTISQSCYLSGVWQTEKYFARIADILREEITPKEDPGAATKAWIQNTRECNSVSLHVRRGDYVTNAKTHQFHGVCSPPYYQRAMNFIDQKISHPVYFIFSDDMEWVRKNFQIPGRVVYVSDKKIPDHEELLIMSSCKHHIIANSSFSWWGAWLNTDPKKIVIAPRKWFAVESIPTQDLIPDTWVTL